MQDRFFIYNTVIDIPLKKNSYIIFEYIFESEYIDIPLVINLKIDDVLENDFNIHLKKNTTKFDIITKYMGVVKASLTHAAFSFQHDTTTSTHYVFFLPFQN